MANNNNNEITLNPPSDTNLPFFAYGIFKPGQLAYSRIKSCVKNHFEHEIDYEMLMRDGVPLITPQQNKTHNKTVGNLIYFNDEECSKKAYEIISKTHSEKLYAWEEIKVGENKANVLMGVNPDMGSYHIEGSIGNYDGRDDPYFKEAIEVVENELNDKNKRWHNINDFFKLQMSYMLLWTAVERYASLKYNNTSSKINQLSKDALFKKSLKKHFTSKRTVYSAENLRDHTLDCENSYESVRYYYTVRCNVAHRGKAIHADDEIIRQSLKELLEIFKDILKDTFDKE